MYLGMEKNTFGGKTVWHARELSTGTPDGLSSIRMFCRRYGHR